MISIFGQYAFILVASSFILHFELKSPVVNFDAKNGTYTARGSDGQLSVFILIQRVFLLVFLFIFP